MRMDTISGEATESPALVRLFVKMAKSHQSSKVFPTIARGGECWLPVALLWGSKELGRRRRSRPGYVGPARSCASRGSWGARVTAAGLANTTPVSISLVAGNVGVDFSERSTLRRRQRLGRDLRRPHRGELRGHRELRVLEFAHRHGRFGARDGRVARAREPASKRSGQAPTGVRLDVIELRRLTSGPRPSDPHGLERSPRVRLSLA